MKNVNQEIVPEDVWERQKDDWQIDLQIGIVGSFGNLRFTGVQAESARR